MRGVPSIQQKAAQVERARRKASSDGEVGGSAVLTVDDRAPSKTPVIHQRLGWQRRGALGEGGRGSRRRVGEVGAILDGGKEVCVSACSTTKNAQIAATLGAAT